MRNGGGECCYRGEISFLRDKSAKCRMNIANKIDVNLFAKRGILLHELKKRIHERPWVTSFVDNTNVSDYKFLCRYNDQAFEIVLVISIGQQRNRSSGKAFKMSHVKRCDRDYGVRCC